jgi:hypothetical protein
VQEPAPGGGTATDWRRLPLLEEVIVIANKSAGDAGEDTGHMVPVPPLVQA